MYEYMDILVLKMNNKLIVYNYIINIVFNYF